MAIEQIELLKRSLAEKGQKLVPFTAEKLERLERLYKVKLPQVYRDFLLTMGNGAGQYMVGSSAFSHEVFQLRDIAIELLSENNFRNLPDEAFVFWMHQGYQFAFFPLNGNDDPPVYYFSEGTRQTEFTKINDSLSHFFIVKLSDI